MRQLRREAIVGRGLLLRRLQPRRKRSGASGPRQLRTCTEIMHLIFVSANALFLLFYGFRHCNARVSAEDQYVLR